MTNLALKVRSARHDGFPIAVRARAVLNHLLVDADVAVAVEIGFLKMMRAALVHPFVQAHG